MLPLLSLFVPAVLCQPAAPILPARSPELAAVLDRAVEAYLKENPEVASRNGDHRFDRDLAELSPQAVERRLAFAKAALAELDALDRARFTEDDQVDAGILRFELARQVAVAPFHPEQMPVTNRDGVQITLLQTLDSIKTDSREEMENWVFRLEKAPAVIDQALAQMRAGIAAKRVQPRVVMLGAAEQCFALAGDEKAAPNASPFFAPFEKLKADDPLAVRAARAVSEGVSPAFRRLGVFLRDEYLPACRETVGESESVDGPASYAVKARGFTTVDTPPEEIHAIGLREIARLRADMLEVIARTDFPRKNDLTGDALLAAFIADLRKDPRFVMKTPEDLLRGYRDLAKRVDSELPRLFRVLPRNPYGVRELPKYMQATAPNGYCYPGTLEAGVPGYFMVNTYRLDQRPTYEMTALFLHEAVPGHHLQLALQSELPGVHPIRRLADYTVFVEGWALYAEQLGLEMTTSEGTTREHGMYEDPYQDFGRLSYEAWRASRLVVDTGIHMKGWSRERAITYLSENTALAPLNIEKEVDRYISWPGQALGYMIGLLKIRELRAQAERALGPKFDLREFHEVVLGAGATPLEVLEGRVSRWIERRGRAG